MPSPHTAVRAAVVYGLKYKLLVPFFILRVAKEPLLRGGKPQLGPQRSAFAKPVSTRRAPH